MPTSTPDEITRKAHAEGEFKNKISKKHVSMKSRSVPLCIKFLANEMVALGDAFLSQTIDRHSIVNHEDRTRQIIDLNSLTVVMRMLGYYTSLADQAELRTWLLNNGCFA